VRERLVCRIFSLLLVVLVLAGAAMAAPSISRISPSVGPVSPIGSPIVITGTGFGATQDISIITVGGVASTPTSWSDTGLVAPVPSSLLPGFYDVIVTVGGAASNAQSFLVIPVITAVSPAHAPVGAVVTVTGTSFGDAPGTVSFNGVSATPSSWSNTSVGFPIPLGATSGQIVITSNGWSTNGVNYYITPNITSITPASGPVNSALTINGSGFGTAQNFNPVTVGGITVTPSVWSETAIVAPVPGGLPAGMANVSVTVNTVASNTGTFVVTPLITSLSTNSGIAGDSITVTGTSFGADRGASTISFNGLTATPASWSDTSIVVPVPPDASTGPVIVAVNGASSNGVNFTVVSLTPPFISLLSPNAGAEGTPVTITGSNFGASQNGGSVAFNGIPTAVNTWSDAAISLVVPPGATTGNVVVTRGGGAVSNGVLFGVPPVISAISPGRGGIDAGVVITGSKFGVSPGDAMVMFNGIVAPQVNWSATQINVTVPDGLSSGTAVVQVTVGPLFSNTVNFIVTDPLMITPTNIGMLVGDIRPFQVLDLDGSVLTGMDLQTDNADILALDVDPVTQNHTLVAKATGTTMVRAVLGDRRGKAPVTVYPGSALPVGALRWDIPTLHGFTARVNDYVRARRLNDGDPDFFVNEFGGGARLRAITGDGLQAWIYPDVSSSESGVFVAGSLDGGAIALRATSTGLLVTKVDSKGNEVWRQPVTDLWDFAVSPDGIVFLLKKPFDSTASVVGLKEADGTPQFTAFLPSAVNRNLNFTFDTTKNTIVCASGAEVDTNQYPSFGKIAVGSDGALYVPYTLTSETLNAAPCKDNDPVPNQNSTMQYSETFSALRVGSDGNTSTQAIDLISFQGTGWTHAISSVAPADATTIPDGTDGVLLDVRRSIYAVDDLSTSPTITISVGRVSSAGYQEYPLPFPPGGTNDQNLMLGERGTFAVAQGGNVGLFDSNGTPLFTYAGTSARLSGTTGDGGIVLQDGNGERSIDTKFVAADGSVRPLLKNAGLSLADHWANDSWIGIFDGFAESAGEPITAAGSDCPRQGCGSMPSAPAGPVVITFVPPHIETSAAATFTSFSVPTDMLRNAPASRAHHRFYIRNGSQNLTLAAREESFEKEVNTSIEALGFIGHSLEIQNTDLLHSIGMNFWYPITGSIASSLYPEPFPNRVIQLGEQCVAAQDVDSCQFPLQKDAATVQGIVYQNVPASDAPPGILNPPAMGKLIDKIPSQAKIVFIGACNLDPQYFQQHFTISPFLQMWDVHDAYTQLDGTQVPATTGRALVVAQSDATNLIDAYIVWSRIVKNLLGDPKGGVKPMNLQDAVTEANKFLLTIPGNQGEQWKIVGDPTVRLR
jgi:hypothetical protein